MTEHGVTMPIYEYKCECGNIFEKRVDKMDNYAYYKEPCPKCNQLATKIIGRTSFVLKGSWPGKDIKK